MRLYSTCTLPKCWRALGRELEVYSSGLSVNPRKAKNTAIFVTIGELIIVNNNYNNITIKSDVKYCSSSAVAMLRFLMTWCHAVLFRAFLITFSNCVWKMKKLKVLYFIEKGLVIFLWCLYLPICRSLINAGTMGSETLKFECLLLSESLFSEFLSQTYTRDRLFSRSMSDGAIHIQHDYVTLAGQASL